jgi:hypothetical protein
MRGIEPLSESPSIKTSPITAALSRFPQPIAEQQAIGCGSFINLFCLQSLGQKGHHLVGARFFNSDRLKADEQRLGC